MPPSTGPLTKQTDIRTHIKFKKNLKLKSIEIEINKFISSI